MTKIELKHVLVFNSIFAFLNGLMGLIIPAILMVQMGFSDAADGPTAIRFFATVIFGMGILMFGIRNESHSYIRQLILLILIFNFSVMTLLFLVFGDLTNLIVLFNIILQSVLVCVYGYFFITNRGK